MQRDRAAGRQIDHRITKRIAGDQITKLGPGFNARAIKGQFVGPDFKVGDNIIIGAVGKDKAVIASPARKRIVASPTIKGVVTRSCGHDVIGVRSGQFIIARTGCDIFKVRNAVRTGFHRLRRTCCQIDRGTTGCVAHVDGVITLATIKTVITGTRDNRVIARTGIDIVTACTIRHDIIAVTGHDPVIAIGTVNRIVSCAGRYGVIGGTSGNRIATSTCNDLFKARNGIRTGFRAACRAIFKINDGPAIGIGQIKRIGAIATGKNIIPGITDNAIVTRTGIDRIIAITRRNHIVAVTRSNHIIARTRRDIVITRPGVNHVTARTRIDMIITITGKDAVIPGTGPDGIVASPAINRDIAIGMHLAGQIDNVITVAGFNDFNATD